MTVRATRHTLNRLLSALEGRARIRQLLLHVGARTDLVVTTALGSKKIIPGEFPQLKVLGWR